MNNQISVLLADENKELIYKMKENLELCNENINVLVATNGDETFNKLFNNNIDVAVIDVILSGKDGFEIIENAKSNLLKTKFIVSSSLSSDTFVQKAMNLGVEYYMIKPTTHEVLYKRIIDVYEKQDYITDKVIQKQNFIDNNIVPKNKILEEKITNIFITVGIPAHIKGYYFLREAIKMAIETPEIVNSITKRLYPSIAERFETSASKVERAIRHAIEVAWNRGKIENINSVFGVKVYSNNEKPTNGEFIALVADKMLIEG